MPSYRIKLANGKSLVLRGDEPPTDADIESAATQAGVRPLLMSGDKGEAPATGPSDSTAAGLVSGLSALVGAGTAAAPAVVAAGGKLLASKAAGIVPAAVALDAAGDVMRGDYKKAAGKGAAAYATSQAAKMLPGAARVAAGMRAASPAAAMASMLAAGHAAKMNPANAPKTKALTAREIAEEEIRRIVGGGM
jgi:hypothetical protein